MTEPEHPGASRFFTYTERRRLEKEGTLGDWQEREIPVPMREALTNYVRRAPKRGAGIRAVENVLEAYHGSATPGATHWWRMVSVGTVDEFLTVCEILALVTDQHEAPLFPGFEDYLNELFHIHRVGFVIASGVIRPLTSPVLDAEIVGPALLRVRRKGWGHAEANYADALEHLRAGEIAEALTASNAAVESAMKAMGLDGDRLAPLLASLKRSRRTKSYVADSIDQVTKLADRLMAFRGEGDAHGAAPGAVEPPPELAALAIHWAGSLIVFLSELPDA